MHARANSSTHILIFGKESLEVFNEALNITPDHVIEHHMIIDEIGCLLH